MSRLLRPWLAALLCIASLFNGFAMGATSSSEHQPCEMSTSGDTGHSPCGGCDEPASSCAQQCAAMCAGFLLARPGFTLEPSAYPERVAVATAPLFHSHAGPPGLQPPR